MLTDLMVFMVADMEVNLVADMRGFTVEGPTADYHVVVAGEGVTIATIEVSSFPVAWNVKNKC